MVTTTTILGRQKIEHPDFEYDAGTAQHALLSNAWKKLADLIPGVQYFDLTGLTFDPPNAGNGFVGTTITLEHGLETTPFIGVGISNAGTGFFYNQSSGAMLFDSNNILIDGYTTSDISFGASSTQLTITNGGNVSNRVLKFAIVFPQMPLVSRQFNRFLSMLCQNVTWVNQSNQINLDDRDLNYIQGYLEPGYTVIKGSATATGTLGAVSGTQPNLAWRGSSNVALGNYNFSIQAGTRSRNRLNLLVFGDPFNIDGSQFSQLPAIFIPSAAFDGKVLEIYLEGRVAGHDLVIATYNFSNVFQGLIEVFGNTKSACTSTPSAVLLNGPDGFVDGINRLQFKIPANSFTNLYFCPRFRSLTANNSIQIEAFEVKNSQSCSTEIMGNIFASTPLRNKLGYKQSVFADTTFSSDVAATDFLSILLEPGEYDLSAKLTNISQSGYTATSHFIFASLSTTAALNIGGSVNSADTNVIDTRNQKGITNMGNEILFVHMQLQLERVLITAPTTVYLRVQTLGRTAGSHSINARLTAISR